MQIKTEFIFNSIEELHEFTSKVAAAGGIPASSSTAAEAKVKAAKAPKAKAEPVAETHSQATGQAHSDNPFANMGGQAAAATAPAQATTAAPSFNRDQILSEATQYIQARVAEGLPIAKLAEIINNKYFIPRGLPQCKAGDLNDHQLADFYSEMKGSISQEVQRAIHEMKNGSLI